MSWLLENMKGAIATLFEDLQTSALQLFTDPTQLSSRDIIILGSSAMSVGAVVWWASRDEQQVKTRIKLSRPEFIPGKVYVHVTPPTKVMPNLSPFEMKLQTYLRVADIPHEVIYGWMLSLKRKTPWIEYNGIAIGDSGLIIEFLNKEKGVDLNKNLSDTDKAVSRAFTKMLEENTYWGLIRHMWIENGARLYYELFDLPWYMYVAFLTVTSRKKKVKEMMWAHGIGRHSKDEVESIMENDLKALSSFLGTKPYLMGEEPTEADAAVFGQLSRLACTEPDCYLYRIVTQDCPNLQAYYVRMKERYWPDWDQLIVKTKKDQ